MSIFLLIFSLCRVVFYLFNLSYFKDVSFLDFLVGLLFDVVATAIIFLPLVVFELFPNKWRESKFYNFFLKIIFSTLLFFSIMLNLTDVAYFQFTTARITESTFTMLSYGNDLQQQIPSFIKDYWFLFIIWIVLLILGLYLYKKVNSIQDDSKETSWLKQSILFIITAVVIVIAGRGVGLRPIEPINVTAFTSDQNVPLVLNSTFTVIKSWGKIGVENKTYFTDSELTSLFNPIHQNRIKTSKKPNRPNVVILLLESFSVEYIAAINGSNQVNTPFLDSLIGESMVYTNCYANGKKSLDAVPSIIASVPKLMESEFITSNYSTNKIESLPKHLNRIGYESAFFHGATNGSMNFDQFSNKVGFNHYFGRSEYANESDFDGTWGIFDDKFFVWSAKQMTEMKQPFFSTIFSLSSHPPYAIPEEYKNDFIDGESKMHNAVKYSDFALSQFFNYAKTQSWYNNTLFIITADHTPPSKNPLYYNEMGAMHIPLVLFNPSDKTLKGREDKVVAQVDIMPTVFDYLDYQSTYFSFGKSIFQIDNHYSMTYYNNKFIIFGKGYMLTLLNDKVLGLWNLTDVALKENLMSLESEKAKLLENKLKAYIQTYNQVLIDNKMTAD